VSLIVFIALLFACCGYALWRGGAPERVAAGLQVAAYAATLALNRLVDGSEYLRVAAGTAALDLLLLVALVLLAWRSTRFWPLWIAGWQAAAIIAHSAKMADPGMLPTGYAFLEQVWAYLMLPTTATGAWRHRCRLVTGDPDAGWKSALT